MSLYQDAKEASQYILNKIDAVPDVAVILGTGLGSVADCLENPVYIDYKDIPSFPVSTVVGHKGRLAIGTLCNKLVVFMCGRVHYYEGYSMQKVALPVQIFKLMGVKTLIITNASGGINEALSPADIVLIRDHIKLSADSSLRGENPSELGERFFDMTNAYDKDLCELAHSAAKGLGIPLSDGIYAYMGGPQFETPAEIRMLKLFGADVVGMSTVPEAIAASHCKLRTIALSCVTNMASGIENGGLNRPVIDASEKLGANKIRALITEIINQF